MKRFFAAIGVLMFLLLLAYALTLLPTRNRESARTPDMPAQPLARGFSDVGGTPRPIATQLNIPWDFAFLPDGTLLVTERTGTVLLLDPFNTETRTTLYTFAPARGEGGLLGIVLDPNFIENKFVYIYRTVTSDTDTTRNTVVRYTFSGTQLTDEKVIIDNIPGAIYHDGGRMAFGPDGKLYITTGDATRAAIAQDLNSLGGKILRINADGSIPSDNPYGSAVWSYGHRNPQGIAWDSQGTLWETEHGRSGITSGMDEINRILPGNNYGWPTIEGDEEQAGMLRPVAHSGSSDTWAPASLDILGSRMFFGGLRGEALYEFTITDSTVLKAAEHFKGKYGRIRTVRIGPDGLLYFSTSNRDGRGSPTPSDDGIYVVDPTALP